MLIKDKFSSQISDLKDVDDRFGGDESWGVKKFVNPKKADPSSKNSDLLKKEEPVQNSPSESKPKPKQFLDKNNMFSILPKN